MDNTSIDRNKIDDTGKSSSTSSSNSSGLTNNSSSSEGQPPVNNNNNSNNDNNDSDNNSNGTSTTETTTTTTIITQVQEPQENDKPSMCLTANCIYYGNPKTNGLCSGCYNKSIEASKQQQQKKEEEQKQQQDKPTTQTDKSRGIKRSICDIETEILTLPSSPNKNRYIPKPTTTTANTDTKSSTPNGSPEKPSTPPPSTSTSSSPVKCSFTGCNKKLGIMSASSKCRCGLIFCGSHMNNHKCTFDYKSLGKSMIAKANPQIIGSKIVKL